MGTDNPRRPSVFARGTTKTEANLIQGNRSSRMSNRARRVKPARVATSLSTPQINQQLDLEIIQTLLFIR
jgi:hypothetical protein